MTAPLTSPPATVPTGKLTLVPASRYSIEQLTAAYNQTRVDYLVPMPMNTARLTEYIDLYDVDLDQSLVALDEERMLGLAMLGVRADRGWVTRLGVLPADRRQGTGQALAEGLLRNAAALGLPRVMLEVIRHNEPAYNLFRKLGFYEVGELVVLRRPPGPLVETPPGTATWLERDPALELTCRIPGRQPWTNQCESLSNAPDVLGLIVDLPDEGRGSLIFRRQKFMLSHYLLRTERGDPARVAQALFAHLHQRFTELDAHVENIFGLDPHLSAFSLAGYVDAFWRMELWRDDPLAGPAA